MREFNGKKIFPCPVCISPREVRITKKDKPYVICNPCGIQVFVRGPEGIAQFTRLLEHANTEGLFERFQEMERRYRLECPSCGHRFWIEPGQIKTSLFDGSIQGV